MISALLTDEMARTLLIIFAAQMVALCVIVRVAWHRGYSARRRQDAIRKLS